MEHILVAFLIRNGISAQIEKFHINNNSAIIEVQTHSKLSMANQAIIIGTWFYEQHINYVKLELNNRTYILPTYDLDALISTVEHALHYDIIAKINH